MKTLWLAFVPLLAGCATVLKSPVERIAVESQPAGSDALIQCAGGVRASAVTPAKIAIPRAADGCTLSISKDGYKTRIVPMERGFNGAYWSNFSLLPGLTLALFLSPAQSTEDRITRAASAALGVSGVLGFLVDRGNGRGFRHFPDEISETLEPVR